MRRFDFQPGNSDSFGRHHTPLSHPVVQPGQPDQVTAAHRFGDLREDPSSDWQHLWIDLGGEG